MLDDLFVPDPPSGDSSNRIANTRFVVVAIGSVPATTLSSLFDTAFGSTDGSLLARNATTWTALPPAWSTYTPSVTAGAGSITSLGTRTGRYTQVGKTVFVSIDVAIQTNGTGASFLVVGLPATAVGVAALSGRDNANGKMIYGVVATAIITAVVANYDASYAGADGHRYLLGGSYEVP